jgi:large subunit ribosomal protein L29
MKIKDIKELSVEELKDKEQSLREELFNLKFQFETGQLDNVMRVRQVKRDIAKILTVANEKAKAVKAAK